MIPRWTAVMACATVALSPLGVQAAMAADGKEVYTQTCAACHSTGVAGAPKLGDRTAWTPRMGNGKPALLMSVLKGKGAMPPKGGNASLSDNEVKSAMEYILSQVK